MPTPPRLISEQERLQKIGETRVLASKVPEPVHVEVKELTRRLGVRVGLVTIVAHHSQHILASVGANIAITPRDHAFCAYTILEDRVLVVEDATKDERFAANPYVVGGPRIRFYAGAPLRTNDGHGLGSLCLLSSEPRQFAPSERHDLARTAHSISQHLGLLGYGEAFSDRASADLAQNIHDHLAAGEGQLIETLVETLSKRLRLIPMEKSSPVWQRPGEEKEADTPKDR
jgi:hypothetical protein